MVARFLSFVLLLIPSLLIPSLLIGCSCYYNLSFCETITSGSDLASVRIVSSYGETNNPNYYFRHFIDVELIEVVQGTVIHSEMTIMTGYGTSCDLDSSSFVIGDTMIVEVIDEIQDSPSPKFTFRISSSCSRTFVFVKDGTIFQAANQAYQDFIENIGNCSSLTYIPKKRELDRFFTVFPNPAFDVLRVNSDRFKSLKYTIYNASGSMIYKSGFEDRLEKIDVSGFAKGIYFIRIEIGGVWTVKRFVKS